MKKLFAGAVVLGLLSFVPACASSLVVAADAVKAGSVYNYTYLFSMAGTGLSVDNIFLGSDDLSPLNVSFTFDGATTTDWSWFSNVTPQDYLDFYNTAGGTLGPGDTLQVDFISFFPPESSHFAVAENGATGDVSNTVTSVLGPTAPSAVPEPATAWILPVGLVAIAFAVTRSRIVKA
jgi:hypothetical protein